MSKANNEDKTKYLDIVCEGGGVKGIALLGALRKLEEEGYIFRKAAGTSSGAIVAALIAVGYTANEIKREIFDNGFSKLLFGKHHKLNKFASICTAGINIPFRKGFCNTKYFEKHLYNLFKAKGKVTFADVCDDSEDISTSRLKIIASDITNNRLLELPKDLIKYGINPMEFDISQAVIMSMSFPGYFMPYVLKYESEGHKQQSYIVDGGLCSNFPIWIFDAKVGVTPMCPTFGLNLLDTEKPLKRRKGGFLPTYLSNMIFTGFSSYEAQCLSQENRARTINIPIPSNIHVTDFNLTEMEINILYMRGKRAANTFLKGKVENGKYVIKPWRFKTYIDMFRNYEKYE